MFNNNEKIFAVKKIYDVLNIKEHTVKEINSYFNLAMDCLEPINIDDNIKKDLIDFSSGIVKRDF